jgi:hypothetical protein
VKSVKAWDDLSQLIKDDVLTETEIDQIFSDIIGQQVTKKNVNTLAMTLEQFEAFVNEIDRRAGDMENGNDEEATDGEDEDEVATDVKIFNDLSKNGKTVTVKNFLAWDVIKDFIAEKYMTKEQVMQIASKAAKGKSELNFEQFCATLSEVEELISQEGEEGSGEEGILSEQDVFNDLSKNGKTVTVKNFLAWEAVQMFIAENYLTKEQAMQVMSRAANGKSELTYEQFCVALNEIEAMIPQEDANKEKLAGDEEEPYRDEYDLLCGKVTQPLPTVVQEYN